MNHRSPKKMPMDAVGGLRLHSRRFLRMLRKVDAGWWLAIGFILACCAYEYGRVFGSRPFSHHLWRQTSCLSMTYNLYMGEGGLLEPWFHNFFGDHGTSGRSAGEFTGLYWFVAWIWKLTGPREDVYRAVMLLLHFAGTWSLFQALRKLLSHGGWAALSALFFFGTPVMAYYSVGFLTEVPAFDLVLVGVWAMVRHYPLVRASDVLVACLFFALAGLLKITALMAPLTLFIWLLIEWLCDSSRVGRAVLFPNKPVSLMAFLAAFGIVLAWTLHARNYNNTHGVFFSNQSILPIWTLPADRIVYYWECGRDLLVYQLFDTPGWYVLLGMLVYVVLSWKAALRMLGVPLLFLVIGVLLYSILWWEALDGHDYYYIIPMIVPVVLLATFLDTLRRRHPKVFASPWTVAAFASLVVYGVVYTANNHEMRTRGNGPLITERLLPLYSAKEFAFWDGLRYGSMADMLDLEPYNRSIGIRSDDLVINFDDPSVCAALYLMRQRGWVQFGSSFGTEEDVQRLIDLGASYLFVVNERWLAEPYLQRFYRYPLGQHRSVRVFDLRPFQGPDHRVPHAWGHAPPTM